MRAEISPASNSATAAICWSMNRPVGPSIVGQISKANVHPRFEEPREEGHRPREPVNLGNDHGNTVQAGFGECLIEGGPIRPPTALDFGELADDPPIAAIKVLGDGCPLRLQAKPGRPLLGR